MYMVGVHFNVFFLLKKSAFLGPLAEWCLHSTLDTTFDIHHGHAACDLFVCFFSSPVWSLSSFPFLYLGTMFTGVCYIINIFVERYILHSITEGHA